MGEGWRARRALLGVSRAACLREPEIGGRGAGQKVSRSKSSTRELNVISSDFAQPGDDGRAEHAPPSLPPARRPHNAHHPAYGTIAHHPNYCDRSRASQPPAAGRANRKNQLTVFQRTMGGVVEQSTKGTATSWALFAVTYLSYSALYFARKPVSVVKSTLVKEAGLSLSALGLIDCCCPSRCSN